MADANVRTLQATLNRFAAVAGFAQLPTDGVMDPTTADAVLHTLAWLANNSSSDTLTAAGLTQSLTNTDGSINVDQAAASAAGLATFIGDAADNMLVRAGAPTVALTSGGGRSTTTTHTNAGVVVNTNLPAPKAIGTNVVVAFQNLPTWGKIAAGIVAALGALGAVRYAKQRKIV